jgi:hypothetical protein
MEGSLEKEHGLVYRWRLTEIDPVVSDVGVGDGMIDSSSGGTNHVSGSKPTGAASLFGEIEMGPKLFFCMRFLRYRGLVFSGSCRLWTFVGPSPLASCKFSPVSAVSAPHQSTSKWPRDRRPPLGAYHCSSTAQTAVSHLPVGETMSAPFLFRFLARS